jgi:DNA-binding NarL/FixJ family response regulator
MVEDVGIAPRKGTLLIRVLIVDDHALVRAGLTAVLSAADGILVVGVCADGAEVPGIAPLARPDVVLMDLRMPGICGAAATRTLLTRQPQVKVLMLSASTNPRAVAEATRAGAAGFLVKGGGTDELVTAVRTVAAGGTTWPGRKVASQSSQ